MGGRSQEPEPSSADPSEPSDTSPHTIELPSGARARVAGGVGAGERRGREDQRPEHGEAEREPDGQVAKGVYDHGGPHFVRGRSALGIGVSADAVHRGAATWTNGRA